MFTGIVRGPPNWYYIDSLPNFRTLRDRMPSPAWGEGAGPGAS